MRIYGVKAGIVHRDRQPPPERFCNRCGKSLGHMWEGGGLCSECSTAAAAAAAPPVGMRRCHGCRKTLPERDFLDAKGRRRVNCASCRASAADASARHHAKKRKERKHGSQED